MRARCAYISLMAIVVGTGCAVGGRGVYYTRPGVMTPAMASIAPADRNVVWQRAVVALLDEGYVPQVLNEASGYISARRREDLVDSSLVGTMATVVVMADGHVRVEVSGVGVYYSPTAFEAAVTTRQQRLMSRIVNQPVPAVPSTP